MKKIAFLAAVVLCVASVNAFASPREIRDLRNEIASIRAEMAQAKEAKAARKAGCQKLKLNFDLLTVFQGTHNESRNVANYRLDITAERALGTAGRAFARFRVGGGDGLLPFRPAVLSGLNATVAGSGSTVDLDEIWYEHTFGNGLVAATFGKINPGLQGFDGNAAANNEAAQFMNTAFVSNASIAWVGSAPALKVAVNPINLVEISAAYFVGDEAVGQADRQLFGIAQVNFKPFANGNYRFLMWSNTTENIAGVQEGYGWAISADQQIFNNFTLFGRYGWAQPEFFEVESALSGGVSISGNIWGRANDAVAIALGRIWQSGYHAASSDRDETHAELFYSISLTNALTLTPSLQYVNNGNLDQSDMIVYGLRARVQF